MGHRLGLTTGAQTPKITLRNDDDEVPALAALVQQYYSISITVTEAIQLE